MVQQANLTLANQSCCISTIHVESVALIPYEKQLRQFEVERALTHLSLLISVKMEQREGGGGTARGRREGMPSAEWTQLGRLHDSRGGLCP